MLPSDDLDISAEMEHLERAVQGLAYDADALDSHTQCTVLYVKDSRRAHDLLVHMLRSNMLCVRGCFESKTHTHNILVSIKQPLECYAQYTSLAHSTHRYEDQRMLQCFVHLKSKMTFARHFVAPNR